MPNFMIKITADGSAEAHEIEALPTLEQIQEAVGGYVAKISGLTLEQQDAVVYCDEEGHPKSLPANPHHLVEEINAQRPGAKALVGNVVIITGDANLMLTPIEKAERRLNLTITKVKEMHDGAVAIADTPKSLNLSTEFTAPTYASYGQVLQEALEEWLQLVEDRAAPAVTAKTAEVQQLLDQLDETWEKLEAKIIPEEKVMASAS